MADMPTPVHGREFLEYMGFTAAEILRPKTRIRSRDALLAWLKKRYHRYVVYKNGFAGGLNHKEARELETLLDCFQEKFPGVYEPASFRTTAVSEAAWIACGKRYGTLQQLARTFREQPWAVSHADRTIAVVTHALDIRELQALPVQVTRSGARHERDPYTPDFFIDDQT